MGSDVCKRIRKVAWEAERLNKGKNETPTRKNRNQSDIREGKGTKSPNLRGTLICQTGKTRSKYTYSFETQVEMNVTLTEWMRTRHFPTGRK